MKDGNNSPLRLESIQIHFVGVHHRQSFHLKPEIAQVENQIEQDTNGDEVEVRT